MTFQTVQPNIEQINFTV